MRRSINPIILQLNDVVKRHNGLPEFLNVDDFRSCLQDNCPANPS